jgi:DNA-binding MarR family transcriptional regulator
MFLLVEESEFNAEVASLMVAMGLLIRRVRAAVASHDLSMTQIMVLARLAKGGPATAADLARAEGMKPQSMGTVIAELEKLGLVERQPHPTDGRQMVIELTESGARLRAVAGQEKQTWLAQAVAQLAEPDQAALFAAKRIIERLVEK